MLWGRVIEGQRGYRAQYAYPKSLYLVPRREDDVWCRFSEVALASVYGVPVGRLTESVAVGTNPEIKALYGLIGVASASIVLGALSAKVAGKQQRKALQEALKRAEDESATRAGLSPIGHSGSS